MKSNAFSALVAVVAAFVAGCATKPAEKEPQKQPVEQPVKQPVEQSGDPFWAAKAPMAEARAKLRLMPHNNMPLVDAEVDGVKCTMLLDTGATHTTLALDFVRKNLPSADLVPVQLMAESNVEGAPRYMRVKTMKIGEAEFSDFGAMALDISHLPSAIGAKIDGILGMSTLGRAPCMISFSRGEVVFVPSKETREGFGRPVECSPSDPMSIFLPVKFGEQVHEVLVDSGSSMTFLSKETGWPTKEEAVDMPATSINGSVAMKPKIGEKGILPLGDGLEIRPLVVDFPMNRIGADVLATYDMLVWGRFVRFRPAR